jgi:hypothetical protein
MRNDAGNDSIKIPEHVSSSNSHYVEPFFLQQRVPGCVTSWLIATIVGLAIDFNDQPVTQAGKVDCDRANWKLRSKFETIRPPTERLQQQDFGQTELTTKLSSALDPLDR